MNHSKAQQQLGMNPSTASHRLVKDLLWKFIILSGEYYCFHCNEEMTREIFSVEHKIPWLHSQNPKELFFDLNNIAFSHLNCNSSAARRPHKMYGSEQERLTARWKRQNKTRMARSKETRQQIRRDQYLRTGK